MYSSMAGMGGQGCGIELSIECAVKEPNTLSPYEGSISGKKNQLCLVEPSENS